MTHVSCVLHVDNDILCRIYLEHMGIVPMCSIFMKEHRI